MDNTRETFNQGFATALDPGNHQAIINGRAVTTLSSYWLHQHCSCGHTFRPGDEVRINGTDVWHDSASLPCASHTSDDTAQRSSDSIRAFFHGLDKAWPPPPNVIVTRVEPRPFVARAGPCRFYPVHLRRVRAYDQSIRFGGYLPLSTG